MQWLINIIAEKVIAEIGIPPVFIDRGDPATTDYEQGDFTKDAAWHDLDLSAIVPENAQAVTCFLILRTPDVNRLFALRKKGQINIKNISQMMTQVGNIFITGDMTVAVDSNRKIQYFASANVFTNLSFTVKGWWL